MYITHTINVGLNCIFQSCCWWKDVKLIEFGFSVQSLKVPDAGQCTCISLLQDRRRGVRSGGHHGGPGVGRAAGRGVPMGAAGGAPAGEVQARGRDV